MMNRLRYFRRLKDITQEQLEVKTGVAQSLVSKIERGQAVLTPATRKARRRIASALGMSTMTLFGEKEGKP